MPNFVSRVPTSSPVAETASTKGNPLMKASQEGMGVIDRFMDKRNLSKALKQVRAHEVDVRKDEAKKTIEQMIRNQGAIARAEDARIQSEQFGTVVLALTEVQKAMVQEQGNSRMAGTLANFEALKDHDDMVTQLYSLGTLNPEQAEIATRTARAIHAENEGRMDNFHNAAAEAVDAIMQAPLKSIMAHRKA
jgi:hypothetical protein